VSAGIVRRTRRAEQDLVEVWLHIAENDARAADRMLADIDDKCRLLALQPELGPARDDIAPGLRFFPVRRYLILYRAREDGIESSA
jgi:toxin ParE1/3/4